MGILVKVLNSASVERRRTTNDSVNLVTLLDQKLGEVRAILTSDTYDRIGKERREKGQIRCRRSRVYFPEGKRVLDRVLGMGLCFTSDQGDLAVAVVLRGHVDDLDRGRHYVYVVGMCGRERWWKG